MLVFGFLNEWLKQPLTNIDEINKRHDLVDYLIDQIELRQMLTSEYLPMIPDIRRLTKKLNKRGNLEDVLKIYQFSKRIPEIVQVFTSFLEDDSPTEPVKELVRSVWLAPLSHHVEPLSKFEEMVETTVDLDAYEENNEFMIKVEFNEELGKIRSKLDALRDEIHSIHLDSAEDLGFDPDKN